MSSETIEQPGSAPLSGARLLQDRLRRQAGAREGGIPVVPRDAELPLSFSQRRLWAVDRVRPGGVDYLVTTVVRLRGPLERAVLAEAFGDVVRRHEVLRTRYTTGADGGPVQVVDESVVVEPAYDDLGTAADAADRLAALVERDRSRPFDLETGPVVRGRLVRTGPDEHHVVVVVHHIAMDAWSSGLFVRELATAYAARTGQADANPEPPRVQYADFAAWQRDQVSGDRLARGVEHWERRLAGLPPLELAADRPRPALWDARGDTVAFTVPAEVVERARVFGRERGATPFMVYLAAFWALLGRYSGQDDFAVGSPVAGRGHVDTEEMLGDFVNMVVLRADLAGEPSFGELVERARDTALDAYAHQEVPFERLVDGLAADRDLSTHPLFQVSFGQQSTEELRFAVGGLEGVEVEPPSRGAKFDQTWTVVQSPDGSLSGEVTFARALFDRATATRMAVHYVRLLTAGTADPGRRIGDLPVLDAAETAFLVRPPVGDAPAGPALHEHFAGHVRRAPDAPALSFEDAHLTYRELDGRANRLAHRLRGLGVRRETLVAICLPRGVELVVAVLAVLKAGGAYLPLDPAHPADRIDYVLGDAATSVVVTDSALAGRVAGPEHVLVLDDPAERAALAALPDTDPEAGAHPEDLAYVIYTSGSTGRPKGVQVTHANVVRLLTATRGDFRFTPDDVWTLFHSAAFDFSVWEFWGAFLHGGRLVVVPAEVVRSPWDLLALLDRERVTVLNQTPSAFRVLVELAESGDPLLDRLALRYVVLAGEAVDVTAMSPWWAKFGDEPPLVVNMYGITETTVHVTYRELRSADLGGDRSPIGRAMGDLTMHVLDAVQRPVPLGVPGEIHVGGPGLARGYLGRPRLTAERFVPDPYGGPGARLYRSGDRARVLPDGDVGYLGRLDRQVKIRGFRIELGEIESCLAAHPSVEAAIAVVRERTAGDRRLIAYVRPAAGVVDEEELRAHAGLSLPSYMVPLRFVPVEDLPLTVNGKIDHRALPDPEGERAEPVGPADADERVIAEAWARVLGIGQVGRDDNFFARGGDSILAIRLVGALRALGRDLTVQDVFRHQTVAGLARVVGTAPSAPEPPLVAPFALVDPADRERLPAGLVDAYPMSMVQVGMIAEMVADRRMNLYHNITSYLIRDAGGFRLPALVAATREVVGRHDVLRTAFDPTSFGRPLQLVHENAEVAITHEDLRELPEDERDAVQDAFRARERAAPFDLTTAPLLRFHVQEVADDRWVLHFTECHPILDGWSHNSLLTELLDVYRALAAGRAVPPSPAPAVRFADYIAAEAEVVADPAHRDFWAGRIGAAEQLVLPAAWADTGGEPFFEVALPIGDLDPALRDFAAATGTSRKSVLLAAHLAVWRAISGEGPFFTGVVCNSRLERAGGDLVRGMFLNTVPLVSPAGAGTWRELVRGVFAEELALWPHRRFPLPAMQRAFGDGTRLLELSFNYIDFHVLDRETVDVGGSVDVSPNEFPLVISTEPGSLVFSAQSSRIGRARVEAVSRLYRKALESLVAKPDGDVVRALLPTADRLDLLVEDDGARRRITPRERVAPVEHARPRPGVETAVAGVFARVLDRPGIGATDDFFALGGHSLLMLRIILRLRADHGIELAFRDFVELRTPRAIAERLASRAPAVRRALLWLTREGDLPPLFCVHPGGGSGHWYRPLAERLAPRRPVAALEWPGLNGEHEDPGDVEGIAALYLAEIREARPSGPYDLLGWCGGGGITWEIARRLTEDGERVRLVLLDPVTVLERGDLPTPGELVRLRRTEELLAGFDRLGEAERAELGASLREVVEDDGGVPILDEEVDTAWLPRVRVWRQLQEAERAYRFTAFPGSVDLVVCDELAEGRHVAIVGRAYRDYLRDWERFAAGGVRLHRVPGDHLGVLREPHVARLAAEVTEILEES
ncbi:amino acid adenylation domain-containing protein [Actinosynnema sp. NPDC023587]|uniref:amino acid adenylation domain-containing protein n=1 Tax=Actinosynnema sp. NPDC023587 TaxID=3154695 RepID=UPI0034035B7C